MGLLAKTGVHVEDESQATLEGILEAKDTKTLQATNGLEEEARALATRGRAWRKLAKEGELQQDKARRTSSEVSI